jgi:hypothetical protein
MAASTVKRISSCPGVCKVTVPAVDSTDAGLRSTGNLDESSIDVGYAWMLKPRLNSNHYLYQV